MAEAPIVKKKIPRKPPPPPQPQQQEKKKKKNAPDRPQPTWLFPPDEENPVLNPKAKTPEEIAQEKADRAKSLDYMKRRVHAAPDRPAPPAQLLTLIGIFLTDFGFNSTSRLFTNERKARQELNGWEDAIGKKIEKSTPTLERIYRDWYSEWKLSHADDTSSSESGGESDSDSQSEPAQVNGVAHNDSDEVDSKGSDDSDDSADSDAVMKDVDGPQRKAKKKTASQKPPASSSSSSSESDADDEDDRVPKQPGKRTNKKETSSKPTVGQMINSLKRKADDVSESSSSEVDAPTAKRSSPETRNGVQAKSAKASTKSTNIFKVASSSDDSSSSDAQLEHHPTATAETAGRPTEDDSSDSDKTHGSSVDQPMTNGVALPPTGPVALEVNSRANINSAPHSRSDETSDSTSSESDVPPPKKKAEQPPTKKQKKDQGAKPTPLAELSAQAPNDNYISNKYVPNAYADKAYQDLSVTRGKGFTKEKNKKKKKSYRGGTIDLSGGKAFKFED